MPLFRRDLSKCPREFKSPFFIKKTAHPDGLLFVKEHRNDTKTYGKTPK